MLFPSEVFLFVFLPAVLAVYYLLFRKYRTLQNIFLLAASLFFYAWGEPKHVFLMIGVILLNYAFGILIEKTKSAAPNGAEDSTQAQTRSPNCKKSTPSQRLVLALVILADLGILGWFKYSTFVMLQINRFLHTELPVPVVELPIGISFFTFQAMSYVLDVYRGRGRVQKNPLWVGLYISLFPQLIAGPIVRYETIAEQIEHRKENFADFSAGIVRFCIGLGKKAILANNMAVIADNAFSLLVGDSFYSSTAMAWLGALSYTFQIYFDFSGYSDMAIGLGQMFGFHFEENFNYPYISRTVSEFWRRWHISLQTWFRDYVYIPLGGSRVSRPRLILNLFIVWTLTGIWHGANWTFIAWGLLYFVLLTFERLTGLQKKPGSDESDFQHSPPTQGESRFGDKFHLCSPAHNKADQSGSARPSGSMAACRHKCSLWLGHLYTMFFVVIGWVIFRADNLGDAVCYIKAMFGASVSGFWDKTAAVYLQQNWVYYVAAILCSVPLFPYLEKKFGRSILWQLIFAAGIIAVFIISVSFICNNSYNPFIYFNF